MTEKDEWVTFEKYPIEYKLNLINRVEGYRDQLKEFLADVEFTDLLDNQGLEIVVPDLEKMVHDILNS
jgi:hypothetical protein